jgi:hypothetical protein
MTNWEKIPIENKKLMMELQKLDANDAGTLIERVRISNRLKENNRELQAYAVALGPRSQMPRLVLIKESLKRSLHGHR